MKLMGNFYTLVDFLQWTTQTLNIHHQIAYSDITNYNGKGKRRDASIIA